MMTSLLALAVIGATRAPLQDTPLDLAVEGATLRVIGDQIGEKMGWDMQFDPNIESEVLVIRTKGLDAQSVIKKIAEVTGTRWTANGNQMLVQPDFEARNREFAKARAANATKIIEAKKKFLEGMKPQTYKDEDGEEFTYDPSDDRILLGEMVAGLSDQFITSIGPGQRVVLSSNPTPMQRALGRFNAQRISDWIKSENEGRQISEVDRMQMMNDPEYQQYLQMFGGSMENMMPKPITDAPQKVVLVVERSGRTEYDVPRIHLHLKVIGTGGKTLLSTEGSLSAGGEEYPEIMMQAVETAAARGIEIPMTEGEEEKPREPMEGDELPIEISEETKAIHDATNMDFENPMGMAMSPKAREMMIRVEEFEPMRYEIGEFLFQAAEQMDKNLVAHLPDQLYRFGRELPKKFGDVRDQFGTYQLNEKTADNYWMITPKTPGEVWTDRVDRKALGATLLAAQTRMFIPLDIYATFMYRFPDAGRNSVASQRLAMFAPQMDGTMFGAMDSGDLLRLYGALSPSERQLMRNGGSVTIGRLSSAARGVLQEMFFGYGATLSPVDVEKDLQPSNPQTMMDSMFGGMGGMFGMGGDESMEPTEAMPTGLPANGVVAMKTNSESYLLAVSKEGGIVPGLPPIGRTELAFVSMLMKNPQFLAEMGQYQEILRNLRAGKRDNINIVVLSAPNLGAKGILTDAHDPDMTKVYGLQNLPDDLKAQMEADREALEKSPMGKMFEMMGSGGFGGPTGPIKP